MSDHVVTDGPPGRLPRPLSPLREHLRDSFWFAPTAGLVLVFGLWLVASFADREILEALRADDDRRGLTWAIGFAEDVKAVVTAISSAMMTFIGVVFSISLVAVQMASGQFSPRVVRIFVRSRIAKVTFTVFLATFLLSLLVLMSYDGEPDPRAVGSVPLVQAVLALVMVGLSLFLFIGYVNGTLRMMRVGFVIDRITREAFRVVAKQPSAAVAGWEPGRETARIAHHGRAGVLRDVHIARLVRAARKQGTVLRLIPRIGDFVVPGTPVLAVHGGTAPPRRALAYTVSVGVERTFHQDLGFGLRQLSDIALRALSPAVNDPTTAVQALDRIVQFLAALVDKPLEAVQHCDRRGRVRLVQPVPGWEELVDLGFAEIRRHASDQPQVTRRMLAGLDDLLLLAPAERSRPLLRHRALLVEAVAAVVPQAADRAFALQPDHQGIG
ncbi:DUF2254 domain-containing protein [Streptomyces sp. TRM66268-LWL]|uniref:DUF2254 domain-containing protein n=1 Tax=Streptomyces polyasparticus TaxID=2767826 RepID=A0ABR7SDC9_9ACTN|nr:DUF2254 domain-containing protein [Streptomyces polyasparticus]MBC9713496.1 DUF2254 domain-containing protein [Streptomyces polyasparticus]